MENIICRIKMNVLQRYLICFYFVLSFFEPYLNGILGSATKYYILILMIFLLWYNKKITIKPFHLFFIFWLSLKLISLIWTPDLTIAKLHMFSQIGMVCLLIILTSINLDHKAIKSIINTLWIGSALIGFLSIFLSHPYHGIVNTRQVLFLFGQEADPNNQAAFLLIGLTIALYSIIFNKKHIFLSVLTIAINSYTLFLTGSRGGFVGLICIVIAMIFLALKKRSLKESFKILLIISIFIFIVYQITIRFLPEDIMNRLFTFSSYEGGSDRDIIWSNAIELFLKDLNFIFGAGWGSYWGYNNAYVASHNTYISMLCDVGIVGTIIFFLPIFVTCIKMIKAKIYIPVLLIVCGFVPGFFIEAINKRFFWNVIFLLFIIYKKYMNSERLDINEKF